MELIGFKDNFDRDDSTTSIGSPPSGETWTVLNGTWGIDSNRLYRVNTGSTEYSVAYIDKGLVDCVIEATIAVGVSGARICFRVSDINNFLYIYNIDDLWSINRREAGGNYEIARVYKVRADGDKIKVTLSGSDITLFLNGKKILQTTSEFNQTQTKHGFVVSGSSPDNFNGRFDSYKQYTLVSGGMSYYISPDGDDDDFGFSEETAWATIDKVNATAFLPGDRILFRRGGEWRGNITTINKSGSVEGGYITYSCYGAGDLPVIIGSVSKNELADWTNVGGNVWVTDGLPTDIGNIIFDDGIAYGFKKLTEVEVTKQNDFWYDDDNDLIKFYSAVNPASIYSSIELTVNKTMLYFDGSSYVIADGLEMKYGGGNGIDSYGVDHIVVRNIKVHHSGGGKVWHIDKYERYGNGIQFWNEAKNILVENCEVWEMYDTGLTNQGTMSNKSQENITFRNNYVHDCGMFLEFWLGDETSQMKNIVYENNRCENSESWSSAQRPDMHGGVAILNYSTRAAVSDVYIRHNTFFNSAMMVRISATFNGLNGLHIDNNVYVQMPNKTTTFWWQGTDYDFKSYQTISNQDANSVFEYYQPLTQTFESDIDKEEQYLAVIEKESSFTGNIDDEETAVASFGGR